MKHAAPQKHHSAVVAPKPGQSAHAYHDTLEEEADRAADVALALSPNASNAEVANHLRTPAFVTSHVDTFPSSVTRSLGEAGMPLENGLRADMERRFGHDFSHVRVHANRVAAESALDVDAQAYTVGHHIVFGAGTFEPHSRGGRRLIAHELAHTIQQSPYGAEGTTRRVLQRKPRTDGSRVNAGLSESQTLSPDGASVADFLSLQDGSDRSSTPGDVQADTPGVPAAPQRAPQVDLSTPSAPTAPEREAQTNEPGRLPSRGAEARADAVPTASPSEMPHGEEMAQGEDSSMPRLATLLAGRRAPAVDLELGARPLAAQREGAARDDETSQSSAVDVVELLGMLASGAGEARKTIHNHAIAARADIQRSAKRSSKKLEDQTKSGDDAVRALTAERHSQIDKTVLAHQTEINWLEKRCKDDAATYTNNAKTAQRDGFAFYREQLANAFDRWGRSFDRLNKRKSDYLTQMTAWNIRRMWRKYSAYNKRFIQGIGNQSEERRQVQREAAMEVVEDYAKEFEKAKTEIVPELAKACEDVKTELNKGREQALSEYDKGLPLVLKGIDEQLAAALPDIAFKAREARELLAKGAVEMHTRVNSVEKTALERNAALRKRVDGQIESGRTSAEQQFQRAVPEAMEPIAAIVDEAVGMLTNTDEELDPDASQRFVDEVVDFTVGAADATSEVFGAARDAGIGTLADAVPFAKRGFAAGKKDLETTLHGEGVENESALINFSIETEKYVRSPLIDLDQTFNTGVQEAEARLTAIVADASAKLREPMETAQAQIGSAVNQALSQQSDAYWHLGRDMHNAARQAAWRYDHPYLKHVVDVVEVALGFALIVGILIVIAVGLVFAFGELAAALIMAVVGGFLAGYFGAKAYEERRKAGAGRLSALLGAIGEVTGINEVRRAFTDSKMKPFDRGLAWGGFWLGLFGFAHGASRFLKVIKVRLPKAFTNPFRLKRSMIPVTTPEAPVVPGLPGAPAIPETPRIGYELPHQKLTQPEVPGAAARAPGKIGFELPHQKLTEPEIPQAPSAPKSNRAGFELPHEKPAEPEVPQAPTAPKSKRVGFELPHQKLAEPEVPQAPTAPKSKRVGFELPHQKLAEPEVPQAPTAPKSNRVGFELPHERAPSADTPALAGASEPGAGVTPRLHHRKPAVPEAAPSTGKRRIGFVSSEEPASTVDVPSGAREQPVPVGETPPTGGVISEMPRAREVPSSHRPHGGTAHGTADRPANVTGSLAPETPRATAGETPTAETPTKGSAVSTVEPETPATAPVKEKLSPAAEARLADERAIQTAREQRVADQERVSKLKEELEFLEELDKALGRKRKRDYVRDAHDQTKRDLKDAESALSKSQRAEANAEAAERINLLRRRDVDPAAALHDPEVKAQALAELEHRKVRVKENDALIKANEADLADAKAKLAQREREFEATRPGSSEGRQSRELTQARDAARKQVESAKRHLEAVEKRTAPAFEANQKHYQRMQDLDRVLHPENYPELSGAKGNFGELQAHSAMRTRGYELKGSSKQPALGKPRDQGLDGVYEKATSAGDGPRHVVGEAKYDQAKLRPGQEKWEWVDERLDTAVGPKHANRMREEGYEYWVMKYDPKTKGMKPTKLWEFRPNGKRGPGGKPLGNPHYVPPI
jgi:Domain of unknown function (DUF4157)